MVGAGGAPAPPLRPPGAILSPVYHALLTRRYLTSKVMPLLASLAVTLCAAMVLITWSVMGGFLAMLLESGRTLIGDVSISSDQAGFGHYEDLIARLEQDEMVQAAAPVIEAYAILAYPPSNQVATVVVKGIEPASYNRVTGFFGTLWWRPLDRPLRKDTQGRDPRVRPDNQATLRELDAAARVMRWPAEGGRPGAILGVEVTGHNQRTPGGWLEFYYFTPRHDVTMQFLSIDPEGRPLEPEKRSFPVVNEFRSGLYDIDKNVVLVPLDALQRVLKMDAADRVEDPGIDAPVAGPGGVEAFPAPRVVGEDPARVTTVLVRAAPGVTSEALRERCREIYGAFADDHNAGARPEVPWPEQMRISTWEDRNAQFIGAVKKETAVVLFVFSFISLTAVFLVLAIFWSMVSEKTRDIGVLRALGAGRAGVAWLWVRYGLAIGLVGAVAGLALAWVIVSNINPIHEWLGSALGIYVWDPSVYYFTEIPSRVEWSKAAIVLAGGVVSCFVGALWPALRAASMDPVKALRFE